MEELKKNQIYCVEITGYSSEGLGVCRIAGRAVFVPHALPGERWEIKILKVTASTVYGKGLTLLQASAARCIPTCPHFGICGGCDLQHMSYQEELRFKLERVNNAFRRIGGLEFQLTEIIPADKIESYRNKGIYAVGTGCTGFFRSRTHEIIPIQRCIIQPEVFDRAANALRQFMVRYNIPAYNEQSGSGSIRHIFFRIAYSTGQAQAAIVTAKPLKKALSPPLVAMLREACPELIGILLNVNPNRGNTVLKGEFQTLWGEPVLRDRLCGLEFTLSPLSFYQINPPQAEKLYDKAVAYAAPQGGTVLDLYCGAGTISLCLARSADRVIGAEIVPDAVENARKNALANGISNVEFICADAGQAAQQLADRGIHPDAIVVDPPRKGLNHEVIDAIVQMSPTRLVYVSCDPGTLARDLRILLDNGYAPAQGAALDMFPRTRHVECVALMSRVEK
jgi:23S rRNA (uracil1939-C5)-methyltransferase